MSKRPQQGEVWLAHLNPTVGHEQAGPPRPVLVISGQVMNDAPYDLSLVVPLSTKIRRLPGHILLPASESGLRADSVLMCEHARSISHLRFKRAAPLALVKKEVVAKVVHQIHMLIQY